MKHREFGRTGLRVPSVGLGTMTWGRDTGELEAERQLDIFLDARDTFVDTAASYGRNVSEEVIGALLREHVDRQDLVLIPKAGVRAWRTGERSSVADASRGSLLGTFGTSLARLSTDHLDLLLVQVPDSNTSLEETAHALGLAVSSRRTRYVGIVNHPAWASVRIHDLFSEYGHGSELVAVEMEHSLLSRGIECRLRPTSQALGFDILDYAPLGRGMLTGKYRMTIPPDSRAASPHLRSYVSPHLDEAHRGVVEAVATTASSLDRKPARIALAQARDAPGITLTVVDARTPAQLQGMLSADGLELPIQIRHTLDEVTSVQLGCPECF